MTMGENDDRLVRLEKKVDRIQEDLERFATKDDLERFATKEDLERFVTKDEFKREIERLVTKDEFKLELERLATKEDLTELYSIMRRDDWNLRQELFSELASHFGAMEERMTHLFEVVMEAIHSKLSLSEAEKIFVKRAELPSGLLP